jgi:hypothetical protein
LEETMELRVWQSFSCNNSSSFRMVARFADATAAADSKTTKTRPKARAKSKSKPAKKKK